MESNENGARILTDEELERRRLELVEIGGLRNPIGGSKPGKMVELERLGQSARAVNSLFQQALGLSADGKIYFNGTRVFIRCGIWEDLLSPSPLPVSALQALVAQLQEWLAARVHAVSTGAIQTKDGHRTEIQLDAMNELAKVESSISTGTLQAFNCWIRASARLQARKYTLACHGQELLTIIMPPRQRLLVDDEGQAVSRDPTPVAKPMPARAEMDADTSLMWLVTTAEGRMFLTPANATTAELRRGTQIRHPRLMWRRSSGLCLRTLVPKASSGGAANRSSPATDEAGKE